MKPTKTILLLATASFILLSSCTREYTCTCCGGFTGGCDDVAVIKDKKKDAKAKCEILSGGAQYQCDLK